MSEMRVQNNEPTHLDGLSTLTREPERMGARTSASVVGRILTYLILVTWAVVCVFPIYWVAVASLKPPGEFVGDPHFIPLLDFQPSLHAWRQVLFSPGDEILARFINTLVVSFGSSVLTVLAGALAAYALVRFDLWIPISAIALVGAAVTLAGAALFNMLGGPALAAAAGLTIVSVLLAARPLRSRLKALSLGNDGLFAITWAGRLLPPVAIVLPLYYMAQKTGLYDSRTALVLIYAAINLPVALWLLRGFIGDLPVELEEAAQLDGASHFRVFITITLPLLRRGLAATFLLIFFLCWNEYLISVYMTADRAMTMAPFLASQMTTREQMAAADPDDYARLAVMVIVMIAPLLLFTGIFQRVSRAFGGHDRNPSVTAGQRTD